MYTVIIKEKALLYVYIRKSSFSHYKYTGRIGPNICSRSEKKLSPSLLKIVSFLEEHEFFHFIECVDLFSIDIFFDA